MALFRKNNSNDLLSLLKEREKKEKELEKKWDKRLDRKYTDKALKAAKNTMLSDAYKIDTMEYEKMVKELKEHLGHSETTEQPETEE